MFDVLALLSSPELELHGIRIHSVRLSSSRLVVVGFSATADLSDEIHPGDVVWFPPGEKHWHGATAMTAMTHIAIQEQLDGKTVEWMEKVSDEQYRRANGCTQESRLS